MNGGNDDKVVLLGDVLDEGDHLKGGSRVETRCRLVEEEELGAGDELRCDTDTALLTTRDTLSDRSANQVVRLTLQTESSEEGLDALDALHLGDVFGEGETGGEVQGLADSERTDERIFLLDVGGDAAESLWVCRRAVDVDGGFDRGVQRSGAVCEDVQEGRLARTTERVLVVVHFAIGAHCCVQWICTVRGGGRLTKVP